MQSFLILFAIIFMTECSTFLLEDCHRIEAYVKAMVNLRSLSVFKSGARLQLLKAHRVCEIVRKFIRNTIRNMHEKMVETEEEERRTIIQKYLEHRAGPTSFLKDFNNRY